METISIFLARGMVITTLALLACLGAGLFLAECRRAIREGRHWLSGRAR
jgi:hypothetical protein